MGSGLSRSQVIADFARLFPLSPMCTRIVLQRWSTPSSFAEDSKPLLMRCLSLTGICGPSIVEVDQKWWTRSARSGSWMSWRATVESCCCELCCDCLGARARKRASAGRRGLSMRCPAASRQSRREPISVETSSSPPGWLRARRNTRRRPRRSHRRPPWRAPRCSCSSRCHLASRGLREP